MHKWLIRNVLTRQVILTAMSAMFFLAFREPIESVITAYFVNPFLYSLNSVWYNDVSFLLLVVTYLGYSFSFDKVKQPWIFALFITITYSYYRFCSVGFGPWELRSLHCCTYLKYADLLYLPFIGKIITNFLVYMKANSKSKTLLSTNSTSKGLLYDMPFTPDDSDKVDLLGYTRYANKLVDSLKETSAGTAFAIGITGKWGAGKTSFMKILERELENDYSTFIPIVFNPWQSPSPEAMIEDFFNSFREKVAPLPLTSISRTITEYVGKLSEIENTSGTRVFNTLISLLWKTESIETLRSRIKNNLPRDKKIVIFIDDVDRLENAEIAELVKLIRLTANFPNTYFIVAYDRNYLINALRYINPIQTEIYLEKIFQLEITLPYYEKSILVNFFFDQMAEIFKEHSKDLKKLKDLNLPYFNLWLENLRDVTRLLNSVKLNMKHIENAIVIGDFILIELLRVKYPAVYEMLYRSSFSYLEIRQSPLINNRFIFHLKYADSKPLIIRDLETAGYVCSSIPTNHIQNIQDFLEDFFSLNFGSHSSFFDTYRMNGPSIRYREKFPRYFAYSLFEGIISHNEITELFSESTSLEDIDNKINQWVNEGNFTEVEEFFLRMKFGENIDEFEKNIRSLLCFLRSSDIFFNHLNSDLKPYVRVIKSGFYEEIKEDNVRKDEYKQILRSVMKDSAKFPYIVESQLVIELIKDNTTKLPLSNKELSNMNLYFLNLFFKETRSVTSTTIKLFFNCVDLNDIQKIDSRAVEEMRNFIQMDLDGFLKIIVNTEVLSNRRTGEYEYLLDNSVVTAIFDSWQYFTEFLNNQQNTEYLKEFRSFLDVYSQNDYKKAVTFDFKVIPVPKRPVIQGGFSSKRRIRDLGPD